MRQRNSSWKLECRSPPDVDGLKLLHLRDATHYYPPHVHEEFCIAMILRGTETYICRNVSHVAVSGDLLCVNAEEVHASKSNNAEYKTVQLKPGCFQRLGFGGKQLLSFPVSIVRDPVLFRTFLDLYSALEGTGSQLEKESKLGSSLENLLCLRSVNSTATPQPPRYVEEVRRYIRSHYSNDISLSGLAEIAKLSPFHLARVFRKKVGVPPHEYQIQVRVARAQRMLLDGHSISDAALETGFFDQSHLTRNFKRITGSTPGEYLARSNIVQDTRSFASE